jgi:hypothetical protein
MVGDSGLFSCILFSACRVTNGSQQLRTTAAIVGQIQLDLDLVSSCVLLTDRVFDDNSFRRESRRVPRLETRWETSVI